MVKVKVLVLEDDLETVEKIFSALRQIANNNLDFEVTVIPDYIQVEELINKNPQIKFDILLLDRDCFLGGSFHIVNLKYFDLNKVISISSVPDYNRDAVRLGITRVVDKEYSDLDEFQERLKKELISII
jgi:hypothetical protein